MGGRRVLDRQGESGTIYSIGSSTRSLPEFLAVLHGYQISTLVDVRVLPYSKRFPHFSKQWLEETVPAVGLRYVFLGEELGGYRREGYEAYMRSPAFANGVEALSAIGREERVAFMCAERFPWKCHRRFIAAELERRGWRVVHIIDKDRTWPRSITVDR
ncbi:MAG: DUF488 family protein [Candidatus Methylomirabilales bacterium]